MDDIVICLYAAALSGIVGTVCMFKREPKLASVCYMFGIVCLVLYLLLYFLPPEEVIRWGR